MSVDFVDYNIKCPDCGAGTVLSDDGIRVCANLGGWEEGDGCSWRESRLESKRYGLCAFVRWEGDTRAVIRLSGGIEHTVDWSTLKVL